MTDRNAEWLACRAKRCRQNPQQAAKVWPVPFDHKRYRNNLRAPYSRKKNIQNAAASGMVAVYIGFAMHASTQRHVERNVGKIAVRPDSAEPTKHL